MVTLTGDEIVTSYNGKGLTVYVDKSDTCTNHTIKVRTNQKQFFSI